jgi:hypothetical protein
MTQAFSLYLFFKYHVQKAFSFGIHKMPKKIKYFSINKPTNYNNKTMFITIHSNF